MIVYMLIVSNTTKTLICPAFSLIQTIVFACGVSCVTGVITSCDVIFLILNEINKILHVVKYIHRHVLKIFDKKCLP